MILLYCIFTFHQYTATVLLLYLCFYCPQVKMFLKWKILMQIYLFEM